MSFQRMSHQELLEEMNEIEEEMKILTGRISNKLLFLGEVRAVLILAENQPEGEQPFGQGHPLQPEEGGVLLNCTLSYLWFIFDGVTGAALC